MDWYAVRCVFRCHPGEYEERLTIWQAADADAAIALAEVEAADYGADVDATYLGFAQSYRIGARPEHGDEVYSLIRSSPLAPDDYISRFFDTGEESQQNAGDVVDDPPPATLSKP